MELNDSDANTRRKVKIENGAPDSSASSSARRMPMRIEALVDRIVRFLGAVGGVNQAILAPKRMKKGQGGTAASEVVMPSSLFLFFHVNLLSTSVLIVLVVCFCVFSLVLFLFLVLLCLILQSWDSASHLKFTIPFFNHPLSINLDPLLPRICDLACNAADRKVKVHACESLHSCFLVLVFRRQRETKRDVPEVGPLIHSL